MARKRRQTRDERKAATRAALIEAAERVFARRGFHGASVDEIAEDAGFSSGALYAHFEGKEDLFLALFEEHIARQVRLYTDIFARAQTLEEEARGGADEWMAYIQRNPHYFPLYVEFWASAMRDPELKRKYVEQGAAMRDASARLIMTGARERGIELDPEMAQHAATVVVALADGLAMKKMADPDSVPDDLYGSTLAVLFQAFLTAFEQEQAAGAEARGDA